MKKTIISITNILVCLYIISYSSCSSESNRDTSYLEDSPSQYDYAEYTNKEMTASIDNSIKIPYTEMNGNTVTIPVKINGMVLDMIFDTGASSTCITLAEAQYFYEKGRLTDMDIIDTQRFQTADGNISVGLRIILRELAIGDQISLRNIEAIVVQNQQAPLLLGQSVMKQFREVSMDRENRVIKFFE